jgi:uncharacterized protein (DUF2236 family)
MSRTLAQGQSRPRRHAERLASRDGYFGPESVIRRVGNSPVTPLLGGGTAVLLQVAHPLVAVGVVTTPIIAATSGAASGARCVRSI